MTTIRTRVFDTTGSTPDAFSAILAGQPNMVTRLGMAGVMGIGDKLTLVGRALKMEGETLEGEIGEFDLGTDEPTIELAQVAMTELSDGITAVAFLERVDVEDPGWAEMVKRNLAAARDKAFEGRKLQGVGTNTLELETERPLQAVAVLSPKHFYLIGIPTIREGEMGIGAVDGDGRIIAGIQGSGYGQVFNLNTYEAALNLGTPIDPKDHWKPDFTLEAGERVYGYARPGGPNYTTVIMTTNRRMVPMVTSVDDVKFVEDQSVEIKGIELPGINWDKKIVLGGPTVGGAVTFFEYGQNGKKTAVVVPAKYLVETPLSGLLAHVWGETWMVPQGVTGTSRDFSPTNQIGPKPTAEN